MPIVREEVSIPFRNLDLKTINLAGLIYRDNAISRYNRIVVTTHGRFGPDPQRTVAGRQGLEQLNLALANRGDLVLYVVRRGYGDSEGLDAECLATPECSGVAGALDLQAAVSYIHSGLRNSYSVNAENIVLLGQSQGGWVVLAASGLELPGVVHGINLSGATNYYPDTANPRNPAPCNTSDYYEQLRLSAIVFGQRSRISVDWIYSKNDHNPERYIRHIYSSFREAGGKGFLHMLDDYETDGHTICKSPELFLGFIP